MKWETVGSATPPSFSAEIIRILRKVNPSTLRPKGRGLLRVDPEPRSFTPSSKTGLGAAERVNKNWKSSKWEKDSSRFSYGSRP